MQGRHTIGGRVLASYSAVTLLPDHGNTLWMHKLDPAWLMEFAGTYGIGIFFGGRGIC